MHRFKNEQIFSRNPRSRPIVIRAGGFDGEILVWANVAVLCTAERPNGKSKPKNTNKLLVAFENTVCNIMINKKEM